jgi:hypothetical protein
MPAELTAARARAYFRAGSYGEVSALVAEALGRARDAGDRAGEGAALAQQALLLHYQAIELAPEEREAVDPAPEQELFDRSLALRLEVADVEGVAESLFGLGLVHQCCAATPLRAPGTTTRRSR